MRRGGSGSSRPRLRVGIDTGGTFTDFHVSGPGIDVIFKLPSTPADPSAAVLEGLRRIRTRLGDGSTDSHRSVPGSRRSSSPARPSDLSVVHGTTVGTNALLTRRTARTAFVTTAGFTDLVEIGRQNRESLYDLLVTRSAPLVPRDLRFDVDERVFVALRDPANESADGSPEGGGAARGTRHAFATRGRRMPAARELEALGARLRRLGVESIAVGFLHSYGDPANERRVGRALSGLGVPVTLSHRVSGEYREYERFSTTIANAALRPVAGRYLESLERGARGTGLTILQSDGTTATPRAAAAEPVRTVLSGPAGGALAADALARRLGDRRVLSFDMGGTSTDAVLVEDGLPRVALGAIAGLPLRVPMIEVRTVGAGGGSIARRDAAGALRVGPESAGADPGPACYGRGSAPTVTDAHLVLGRLGAHDLLGGALRLDAVRARSAVGALARALNMSVETCAEGILEVVEATMERALRAISMERGVDPRGGALYAFGGAGGLHACALAARLGIRRVVIPPGAGVFSATGLCGAMPGVEVSRTVFARAGEDAKLREAYRGLASLAASRLRAQGISSREVRVQRFADLRYAGQSHEITVAFGPRMETAFARAHQERFGHVRASAAVEVVTLRLRAGVPRVLRRFGEPSILRPERDGEIGDPGERGDGSRSSRRRERAAAPTRVFAAGRWTRCRVVGRADLPARGVLHGPARVTEYSATTFLPSGWTARPGPSGVLVLAPSARRRAVSRRREARS